MVIVIRTICQGCFKDVEKKVSKEFQEYFQGFPWKFQGCLQKVLRVFYKVFKVFPCCIRKVLSAFLNVSRRFSGCFKRVPRGFQEGFNIH